MLSDIEKALLNIIQTDFPILQRPYKDIGAKLNISEADAFDLVLKLTNLGIIRRLGATFDSKKLGYSSTLCAARVRDDLISSFVSELNSYPGVTHNYLRNDYYNIWFTFIGKSDQFIEDTLNSISERTGVKEIVNLPSKKMFKVKVDLNV